MPLIENELFLQHSCQWTSAMGSPAEADPLESAVARGKLQILRDVRRGDVPITATSFAQLHDYVDANYYGDGFNWPVLPSDLDDDAYEEAFTSFWNTVQHRLDAWIRTGQMRAAVDINRSDAH
ncbi:MAG: hypothetical protein SGJ19_24370 [Planctomycetia bacterium]|nr:hypothetical protein [Planctomycetia bacterium]